MVVTVNYLGKMDHTTCLAFQIGQKYELAPHQANLSNWTTANTGNTQEITSNFF